MGPLLYVVSMAKDMVVKFHLGIQEVFMGTIILSSILLILFSFLELDLGFLFHT